MRFSSGLPETVCGAGSTLKATENIRVVLPYLLKLLGVRSLLDAPCGDGHWIAQTDLSGIEYWGADYNEENVQLAVDRARRDGFEPSAIHYVTLDLVEELPARVDAIMCRDFFQHLQLAAVAKVLANIKRKGICWLIATSFDVESNEEIDASMFRPLNLRAAPFDLGVPVFEIPDPPGSGRVLAVWRI